MRCSYCGRENPDNARFCGRCGRQTDINFPGRNTDRNSYPGSVNDRRNAFSDSIPSKGSVKKNGGPQKKKHRAALAAVTAAAAVTVIVFLLFLSGLSLPDSENFYTHDTVDIATVLAGGDISGAITTDGILYMWGCGDSGQIAGTYRETVTDHTKVLTDVVSASISSSRDGGIAGAVTSDGSLYVWGTAYCGEFQVTDYEALQELNEDCGTGGSTGKGSSSGVLTYLRVNSPVKIMDGIEQFVTNSMVCGAIDEDGDLYMWGFNGYGQLGAETAETNEMGLLISSEPIKVLENVKEVSIGSDHAAAVTTDGALYMWGNNEACQIGSVSSYGESVTSPQKIMEDVQSVYCGFEFTAVITTDGNLYTWGSAKSGRLGNGSAEEYYTDTPCLILEDVSYIDGTTNGAIAITKDGSLYTWGGSSSLIQDDADASVPSKILNDIIAADMGVEHGIALDANGSVYAWGWNAYGQYGDGSTDSSTDPIEVDLSDILKG